MTMLCRRLPHEVGSGPHNMALDEALLDAVAENPTQTVIRTYGWTTPTLSLGYFQTIADVEADPRWSGVDVVRRPTGGGALFHDHEVTYAVVIPGSHPLARPSAALYRAIHEAIAVRLRGSGWTAHRRGPVAPSANPRPFLCFADQDTEDVVASGVKLVGSAQRRRGGAVLQHGSLLLTRSPTTPELPGLTDLKPSEIPTEGWVDLLRETMPEALGLEPHDSELCPSEVARAVALEANVYANPEWTRRR